MDSEIVHVSELRTMERLDRLEGEENERIEEDAGDTGFVHTEPYWQQFIKVVLVLAVRRTRIQVHGS